jgi:hypothetical protein
MRGFHSDPGYETINVECGVKDLEVAMPSIGPQASHDHRHEYTHAITLYCWGFLMHEMSLTFGSQ